MKKIVHIIPVGHTKTTLVEGMRQFPFHKVILVLGKKPGPGEEEAEAVAKEIENELSPLVDVEYLRVDVDDVAAAAIDITRAIKREIAVGNEVKLNASGSLRTVGISCYLASAVTGADLYVALPEYSDGMVSGIRSVLGIPSFPLKDISSEELSILQILLERGETNSVDDLIHSLGRLEKGSSGYQKERARMSYHIKKLKDGGFIETRKQGKNLRTRLTNLGHLYSIGRV